MPNRRGTGVTPSELETANPWSSERWQDAEPQGRRGPAGRRGVGDPVRPREGEHAAEEWSGVNPLPPILPSMPRMKPGDQGG